MKWLALLLLSFALNAFAQQGEGTSAADVRLIGDRIEFRGIINDQTAAAVFELYAAADKKPTIFRIESVGGKARAAMQLGIWIFDNRLDVEVETFCHSSCANYVFPAGATKTLSRAASLVWHGGVTQPVAPQELEALLDQMLAQMDRASRQQFLQTHTRDDLLTQMQQSLAQIIELETLFFQTIGVDQRITTLGFWIKPPPLATGRYVGWDYSLDDLEILGVHNIRVKDNETWQPELSWRDAHTYRVRLSDVTSFQRLSLQVCPDDRQK